VDDSPLETIFVYIHIDSIRHALKVNVCKGPWEEHELGTLCKDFMQSGPIMNNISLRQDHNKLSFLVMRMKEKCHLST
jgi:hypothetical protein